MTDQPQEPDISGIPEAVNRPKRRYSIQLVWIIPIIAALIGATLAVKSYLEHGRTVTISFKTGEGLEADKTRIKYKEVEIGKVKNITIAKDRSHVIVTAQLTSEAEDFLVEDTLFWVARPRISGSNVSGLGTLTGGTYIGVDVGKSTKSSRSFKGVEVRPIVTMDLPGSRFMVHSPEVGSLNIGSPILFRRLQVGQVVALELDKDGKGVALTIFVNAPYDQYVKTKTLFWHASGVDLNLSASGLKVNTESLVSIILGGIAFLTPDNENEAPRAAVDSVFTLFGNKDEAMDHSTTAETYVLVFKETVRGLSVGAPVEFNGVTLGEVTKIKMESDPLMKDFYTQVEVRLYPDRIRSQNHMPAAAGEREALPKLLPTLINRGLRAQLRSGSLLTGQLYVALDFFPKARKVNVDFSKKIPELPTVPAGQGELQATLTRIAKKIEKMPLEEIAAEVRQTVKTLDNSLRSAEKLVNRVNLEVVPAVKSTLDEAHKTLGSAKQTLSTDAPLQQDLRETLREVTRTLRSVRDLADYLERNPEVLIRGKKKEGQ